jgi:NAD(P)-dependent dehydrogenase (short-subunit alcohol dehydrogenase family)
MTADLSGRHIVVTGGTGALGMGVVGELLGAGAVCHVPWLHEKELERFAYRDRVRLVGGIDLRDEGAVEWVYAGTPPPLWGSVHIAGGFMMSPCDQTTKAEFVQQFEGNTLTAFLCCREAVKRMTGGGRIVNVAARPGLMPEIGAGMVAYTASKAAVAALTQALAAEVVGRGILVNAVVPSIMDTPANRAAMPSADHSKWVPVAEVAATIAFLISPANAATRGGLVPVYGRS